MGTSMSQCKVCINTYIRTYLYSSPTQKGVLIRLTKYLIKPGRYFFNQLINNCSRTSYQDTKFESITVQRSNQFNKTIGHLYLAEELEECSIKDEN